jgi:hypothetical protein
MLISFDTEMAHGPYSTLSDARATAKTSAVEQWTQAKEVKSSLPLRCLFKSARHPMHLKFRMLFPCLKRQIRRLVLRPKIWSKKLFSTLLARHPPEVPSCAFSSRQNPNPHAASAPLIINVLFRISPFQLRFDTSILCPSSSPALCPRQCTTAPPPTPNPTPGPQRSSLFNNTYCELQFGNLTPVPHDGMDACNRSFSAFFGHCWP